MQTINLIMGSAPELMTVKELAQHLRVSVATIYRYVRQRRVPFIALGGHLRFDRDAVRDAIEKRVIDTADSWK